MQDRIDTGLACLTAVAKYHKIPTDMRQLERAYVLEEGAVDTTTLVRAARELRLKVRAYEHVSPERLGDMVYPAIIRMQQGNYIVITGMRDGHMYILDPRFAMRPVEADRAKVLANWSGEIILFTRRFELAAKARKFGFRWFLPVIGKYKHYLGTVLGLSFLLQLLGLATPLFTQVIIDKVLVHRSTDALDILVAGMILCAVFTNWLQAVRSYLFTNITSKMDVVLSSHLFRTITALPIKYFDKWQVGDVVSRIGELENLRNFITGSSLTIVLDIVFATVYFCVMVYYSRLLTLVVLVVLPLFVLLNLVIAPIYKRLINDRFLIGAENRSFLIETITGIHTVKAAGVEQNFVQRYEEILARYVRSVFSVINVANVAGSIGLFLQQIFNLAILWIGAACVMEKTITVGELIAFQMMAGQLIAPVMRLVNMWQYFQQTRVSMDRLGDIMNEKTEPAFNPSRTTLPALQGDIALENVTFRYTPDGSNVLEGLSLRIAPGTKVGIVGRSGSGKSTLTKLIQRLYLPESGRILIDGVDIAQVEPAWLRRQIGVVLQDSMLFGGTIEENIKIACPNATHEQVAAAAHLAGADTFIEEFPQQYDTFVGERGSLLSGGQRQRIAIARALILDPRVLIFDEATSALDYESEHIIMENLAQIAAGRTMLMIAHRLSTVEHCDAIIVIDHGRIVEAGSHQELLARRGAYYHLYMAQME
ncbi:MAG: type I secretion system permease/ATPase [Selenomonas bovis]|nr:type I secretion system permease/ATPase [Selenomonas bovis]